MYKRLFISVLDDFKRYGHRPEMYLFLHSATSNGPWLRATGRIREHKMACRWEQGVWLGIKHSGGESIIGTEDGVIKARDWRKGGL